MRKLKTIIPVAGILLLILSAASYNDIRGGSPIWDYSCKPPCSLAAMNP